ncbi:MAG: hypothetical protein ACP5D7_24120 [Limnospira sp.]
MNRQFYTDRRFWIYAIALFVGYTLAGWFLAAFEVPGFVWLGMFGITLHLAKAGTEAILVANAWVVSVMFVGAVLKTWPTVWLPDLPMRNAPLWAIILIGLWVLAIALVMGLAWGPRLLERFGLKGDRHFYFLLGIPASGFGLGYLIFRLGWFP